MWCVAILASVALCAGSPERGSLRIVSDDEPSYTDVIVKRINDTLSLTCGDGGAAPVTWSLPPPAYARLNSTLGGAAWVRGAHLQLAGLKPEDSGPYVCAAPPYSVGKHLIVQPPAPAACVRGGFSCGPHCVLPRYVCDGHVDCKHGEDESEATCGTAQPCYGKLPCQDGRCISDAWCCDPALERDCVRPSCCELHAAAPAAGGGGGAGAGGGARAPAPPDDFGFIQTGIYTVTACALIFMIAVVLLVSAICKMHMKRAALHSYARAERARQQYAVPCPYPPRYEPARPATPQCQMDVGECEEDCVAAEAAAAVEAERPARPTHLGLTRLTDALFTSRYRAVPTRCCDADVEMTCVAVPSPSPLAAYRSPAAYCDYDYGYTASDDAASCGRDLHYLGTPLELYVTRRRAHAPPPPPPPVTLRLGRFRLSLPRLARAARAAPAAAAAACSPPRRRRRPDTPDVADADGDTYTLNGRTIRLLGGDFENYPQPAYVGRAGRALAPPPYSEAPAAAAPAKPCGPPPAYLSREDLVAAPPPPTAPPTASPTAPPPPPPDCNGNTAPAEPPPRYEELPATALDDNANATTG